MAETGIVGNWDAAQLAHASSKTMGTDPSVNITRLPKGNAFGVPLPKNKNVVYTVFARVPHLSTLTTGIKFDFLITDDGTNANDLGLVGVVGVTPKIITTDTDTPDMGTGAAAEVTATVTLNAATGIMEIVTVTIINAALDGIAVDGYAEFQFRRVGDNASDTCPGRLLLANVYAYAY